MKQLLKTVGATILDIFCLLCLFGGWVLAPTTYVPANLQNSQR
jgi:hypothetical protein